MDRRNFLKSAALAAAAPAAASAAGATGPIKKAVSIWAFPRNKPSVEAMKLAKEAGFQGIELAFAEDGEINFDSTAADMQRLSAEAQKAGIEITSLATGALWQHPLTSEDATTRERGRAIVRKCLELAAGLGVDAILVVPGLVGRGTGAELIVGYETAWRRAQEALKELAPEAARHRVVIGVENVWNRFLLSPLEMKRFLQEIGSPWVMAYLDVGNILRFGYPQDWIRTLGPLIKRVHVKDFKLAADTFVGLLEGDVDWKAVVTAFREVNYRGWWVAEVSPNRIVPDAILWDTSRAMDFILAL